MVNTSKYQVSKLPTNCLSVFDHFVGLALKGLKSCQQTADLGILIQKLIVCIVVCKGNFASASIRTQGVSSKLPL